MSASSTAVLFQPQERFMSDDSSLYDGVYEIINTFEDLYDRHEGAIDLYMASKHRDAYLFTAEEEGEDVEEVISENWWPATRVVCDIGAPKIDDPDQFVADLRRAVEHLASGGKIVDGELK